VDRISEVREAYIISDGLDYEYECSVGVAYDLSTAYKVAQSAAEKASGSSDVRLHWTDDSHNIMGSWYKRGYFPHKTSSFYISITKVPVHVE